MTEEQRKTITHLVEQMNEKQIERLITRLQEENILQKVGVNDELSKR